ncbi:hypothetical protein DXG03_002724 [Asterophora parasitica]|uniref:Uncharacterized protein n=1 Tax=Asterophora parasitica TaxID=117018 RepID=A0A9P7FZ85_9AGAR|nr:hypothetical protein DXG03_002724 [Asterophora parasitica]
MAGYPAGDEGVVRFLEVKYGEFREDVQMRHERFFVETLEQALAWIVKWREDNHDASYEAIPAAWRRHLQNASERAKLFDVAIQKTKETNPIAVDVTDREFPPSAHYFWTYRDDKHDFSHASLHSPFVELPFDIWKEPVIAKEGEHTADDICEPEFMARFGRPL